MGACCYNDFNHSIPYEDVKKINTAIDDMAEIHGIVQPSSHPVTIPYTIRTCRCITEECTCPINYPELVRHIIRNAEHRMYSIKGSTGYHHSTSKLAYLLYLAK
jgi:hypothetical protein